MELLYVAVSTRPRFKQRIVRPGNCITWLLYISGLSRIGKKTHAAAGIELWHGCSPYYPRVNLIIHLIFVALD